MPTVSVIIANWNGRKFLGECLDSLRKQTFTDFEVVIVDNGSTDGSVEFVKNGYGDFAEIIELDRNCGYGAANNRGIEAAKGRLIVLLNNDTEVDKCWLETLTNAAIADDVRFSGPPDSVCCSAPTVHPSAHNAQQEARTRDVGISGPRVGMFASKILNYFNRDIIDNVGHLLYPDGLNRGRGRLEKDDGRFDTPCEALFPSGCAALYRREMLDEIGLFDEDFFAYGDDTDIGLRGRLAGWGCWYIPASVVYHRYSATAGEHSSLKAYLVERNRVFIALKYLPASMLLASPWHTLKRLTMQALGALTGRGAAGRFAESGSPLLLVYLLLKAYASALGGALKMMRKRVEYRRFVRLSPRETRNLLKRFRIGTREIALKD